MSITTMEALEAVPVSESIEVTTGRGLRRWTRVADGFSDGVSTLSPAMFAGEVDNGRVSQGGRRPPEAGVVYFDPSYDDHQYIYIATGPPTEGNVPCLQFRHGIMRDRTVIGERYFPHADGRFRVLPEDAEIPWLAAVKSVVPRMENDRRRIDGLARDLNALGQQRDEAYSARNEAIRLRDIQANDAEALRVELENLRRTATVVHASAVVVHGTSVYAVDHAEVEGQFNDVAVTDIRDAQVDWNTSVLVKKEGVGCQCDSLTEDEVRAALPADLAATVTGLSWEQGKCA